MALYHMWAIALRRAGGDLFSAARTCCSRWCCCSLSTGGRASAEAATPTAAATMRCWRSRVGADPLSLHQLRIRRQPHLLHRRSDAARHDHGHDHDGDRAGGDAPCHRLGAAASPPSCSWSTGCYRPARADAADRPALHDDRGHLRLPLAVSASYVLIFVLFGASWNAPAPASCSWISPWRSPATPPAGPARCRA